LGIGLATAVLPAEHSAKVVLVYRSKEKLEKLSKELALSIAIDVDMTKIPEN
jgi:short-subunit dehydrogenase